MEELKSSRRRGAGGKAGAGGWGGGCYNLVALSAGRNSVQLRILTDRGYI